MTTFLPNDQVHSPIISNQWEYFEFQMKHNSEKRRQLEDFYKIIEERAYLEDQYFKGLERIINSLEQLNLEGHLQDMLKQIISGQKERIQLGRSHSLLVRKGALEPMKEMMKKQCTEVKSWAGEEKKLEKEYKGYLERIEKLKKEFMSQAKECDVVGLEAENTLLSKKTGDEERTKVNQKYTESQNAKMDKETNYISKIMEYNSFLDQFQRDMEKINKNLVDNEVLINGSIQQALIKFLDYEKVQSLTYEQNVVPLCQILEGINVQEDAAAFSKTYQDTKEFPGKMQAVEYNSFLEQALFELREGANPREEEIAKAFRKYFDDLIREDSYNNNNNTQSPRRFHHEELEKYENEGINFLACVISSAWGGGNINNDSMQKLQKLMSKRLFRNIVVVSLEQFRFAGKFSLSLDGFRNIKTILFSMLDECLEYKDIINTSKVMIMSLTFWKISKTPDGVEEKKYLQDGIQYHPLWKDLDYWSTANFLSIHEEIAKKLITIEGGESERESHEKQNMIVYSQLLSCGYNMISFGVERGDIKKMVQQFYHYYSLDETKAKELMNTIEKMENPNNAAPNRGGREARPGHRRGNSLIRLFTKKNPDSPESSSRG